jgi:hypothetical protein
LIGAMSSELSLLGIDLDDLEWKDFALCQGRPTNEHYDDYESDENIAKIVDERCLSCPVMVQCLQRGMDNGEWGVWGGIYLVSGKKDTNKNAHKTQDVWDEIRKKIGENALHE